MKPRQQRQSRRKLTASPVTVTNPMLGELQELRSIGEKLDALQHTLPGAMGIDLIYDKLDRIERRIDTIDAAASKKGAVAGAIAGGLSGCLVSTTIMLIKARMGF